VIFVTVHRLRQTRATGTGSSKLYKGVLLGWPRDGAPLVVLIHGDGERTLTTSHVRRVLHDETGQQMFVETRNTVYRVTCTAGSETEWKLEMLRAASQANSFGEDAGPTDVREPASPPSRKRRDSLH
jgi:hypothetical protein